MCQCLCAEVTGDVALQLGRSFVSVDVYRGCRDCGQEIGFYVRVFDNQGRRDFLRYAEIAKPEPSDNGTGSASCFHEIFSVEDLAKVLDEWEPRALCDYETLGDWIRDDGLELIHRAITLCEKRRRETEEGGK